MSFRSVTVASEADVRVRAGQLVVTAEQATTIPIEDIAVLILENQRSTISAAALSALSEAGVPVLVCDQRHMPGGMLAGVCSHSRQYAVAKAQIGMSLPFAKRLWQAIVQMKIGNQARCLDYLDLRGGNALRECAGHVLSGDSTSIEASAARRYFASLMPGERRHDGGRLDGALDYGYAVVRALVCRSLVGHGLYPALGIHHANEFNTYNLGDDLLEPFRPIVDAWAYESRADLARKEGRQSMAAALRLQCRIDGETHSVLTAVEKVVAGLQASIMEKNRDRLVLPEFDSTVLTVAVADQCA